MGWYTEKEGGQQMTQYDDFENAVTLYAQWSPDALTPVIADQPDDVDEQLINTEIFLPMTVLAPTDGGALSYQWYRCNEDGTEAQPVEGATESTGFCAERYRPGDRCGAHRRRRRHGAAA